MPGNDCHVLTKWCFTAQIEEVCAILFDVQAISDWWPGAYLEATAVDAGNEDGVGRSVMILSKGPLIHTFRWKYTVVRAECPAGFCFEANGDLVGTGEWRLSQNGEIAHAELDWRIAPDNSLLNIVKPAVRWNHEMAMKDGERCLCAELKRRRRLRNAQRESAGVS